MAYENARKSGVTNMLCVALVSEFSGLTKEQIIMIMEHYGELKDKYIK